MVLNDFHLHPELAPGRVSKVMHVREKQDV
jgi:hypothetical protein